MRNILLIFACVALFYGAAQAQTKAFPTAEGFGMYATGGRGGQVVEVTNLLDDASGTTPGSLRWALKQHSASPITVVFRVSGVINLVSDLRVNRSAGTTIAGQTAPGDGICIRGAKCNFGGSTNLIIRHLRFRIGLKGDTAFAAGGSIGIENANNFIIDHCTFGWSGEENMTIYDNNNTTIQWCILHEGLYASGHAKGARSYGSQWGGQTATYHHNLLAHNVSRTPRFNGARSNDRNVLMEYVNNVNYNWGKQNSAYGGDIENLTHRVNFINNYYKPGPARPGTSSSYFVQSSYNSGQGTTRIAYWYMSGNVMEGSANAAITSNNALGVDAGGYPSSVRSSLVVNTPFQVPNPVKAETAIDAYHSVLKGAGAFPRDTVDRRIINEVKSGTASGKGTTQKYLNSDGTTYSNNPYYNQQKGIIDHPSAVGGYPEYKTYNTINDFDKDGMDDAWELVMGLDPANSEDRNTLSSSGYTALEVYLSSIVGEIIPFGPNDITKKKYHGTGIYPVNAKDFINILSPENITGYTVLDATGKCMDFSTGKGISRVNVEKLNKGLYILALKTETGKNINLKFTK